MIEDKKLFADESERNLQLQLSLISRQLGFSALDAQKHFQENAGLYYELGILEARLDGIGIQTIDEHKPSVLA